MFRYNVFNFAGHLQGVFWAEYIVSKFGIVSGASVICFWIARKITEVNVLRPIYNFGIQDFAGWAFSAGASVE